MDTSINFPKNFPPQHQDTHPGLEEAMNPKPVFEKEGYNSISQKLNNKVAIITGGDSGIGRAVALSFIKQGAKVAIIYLNENNDAQETKRLIEQKGGQCLIISGDIGDENFCINTVNQVLSAFGGIDILVNNAAEQHTSQGLENITAQQLEKTFKTNVFGAFYMAKAVLPHLKQGSCIINTTSVTAYLGNEQLIDYSATKGALTTFTRSLALNVVKRGIRVNAVAPGPIWTPLIPSSFDAQKVSQFGVDTPMARAGQPVELGETYVFLASQDASYITGQTIHVNGGEIVNG
ncbi:putative oxidoreductase YhxC [Clostridium polyendosporum]|uniref:Oxidoreductase YhxC n=1 Tax=Clostridium polyendosporum TaxID=69208 RepID=A0A919RYK6_9CLOT|nr:SDR family oxidoreductase [Clostridium polyendosporum]GIM28910.1 putative oxidoreductase YhxC [Clostridium polyendosporum]